MKDERAVMIVPDLNILVYAFNASSPLHKKAVTWWEKQVNSGALIGIPWVVLMGFVRLLTGRQIVENPYSPHEIFEITDTWFSRPSVRLLEPTQETYSLLRRMMLSYRLSGSGTTDASIAAQAIEHRATLYTNDTDFFRFKELQLENPLE